MSLRQGMGLRWKAPRWRMSPRRRILRRRRSLKWGISRQSASRWRALQREKGSRQRGCLWQGKGGAGFATRVLPGFCPRIKFLDEAYELLGMRGHASELRPTVETSACVVEVLRSLLIMIDEARVLQNLEMVRSRGAREPCKFGKIAYAHAAGVLEQRHENELVVLVAERYKHVPASAELARELLHGTRRCLRAADIAHGASFARTFMRYCSMVHKSEPFTALWGIGCMLSSSGKKNDTNGWTSGEGIAAGMRSVIPYSRKILHWPAVCTIRGSRVITTRYMHSGPVSCCPHQHLYLHLEGHAKQQ